MSVLGITRRIFLSSPSNPASVPSDTPHAMDITIHAFLIRGRIVWATLGTCAGFTAMMTRSAAFSASDAFSTAATPYVSSI